MTAGRLRPAGRAFVGRGGGKLLRALRVAPGAFGSVRITAASGALGLRGLSPPFVVSAEVGDDGATAVVRCPLGPRGVRCATR